MTKLSVKQRLTNWFTSIIYDVEGHLDEYQQQQLDRFGHRLGLFLLAYVLIQEIGGTLLMGRLSVDVVLTFILVSNQVLLMGVIWRINRFVRCKMLNVIEVDAVTYRRRLVRARWRSCQYSGFLLLMLLSITFTTGGEQWPLKVALASIVAVLGGCDRYGTLRQRLRLVA